MGHLSCRSSERSSTQSQWGWFSLGDIYILRFWGVRDSSNCTFTPKSYWRGDGWGPNMFSVSGRFCPALPYPVQIRQKLVLLYDRHSPRWGFLRLFILEQDRESGEFNYVEIKGRGPNTTSNHSHILKAELDVFLALSGYSERTWLWSISDMLGTDSIYFGKIFCWEFLILFSMFCCLSFSFVFYELHWALWILL